MPSTLNMNVSESLVDLAVKQGSLTGLCRFSAVFRVKITIYSTVAIRQYVTPYDLGATPGRG